MKVIATKNVNGAWYWRIVGGNGACLKSAKIVAVAGGFEFQIED
tara:strand:+ start:153 stop:284 length:132 start_codon:yes stop_codon:yes gene_type:complete